MKILSELLTQAREIWNALSKFRKERHDEKVRLFALRVWAYIQQECHGMYDAIKTTSVLAHFECSERQAKEALRWIQKKGLVTTNLEESTWFSTGKARFYSTPDVS